MISKVWKWLKDNVVAVLLTIVAIMGAGWLWKISKDKEGSLRDQLKVERTKVKIAELAGRRAVREERELGYAAQDEKLDQQIAEAQRDLVAARESVEGRSLDEIAARFNELYGR
jgi:hypothetical protein